LEALRNAFGAAFKFFGEMIRLERGTEAGRANIILTVTLIIATAVIYVSDRFGSVVANIFGQDSSDFPVGFILITLVLLTVFCVSLIFIGEVLRGSRGSTED
jgi:hypothetical protein